MSMIATTKLSSKGQIVIPEEIRNVMGFHTGDQFIVVAENDMVILKTIPKLAADELKELVPEARRAVNRAGVPKDFVELE